MSARLRSLSVVAFALVATACTTTAPSPSPTPVRSTAASTQPAETPGTTTAASPTPATTEPPPCGETANQAPECLPPTPTPAATAEPTASPSPSVQPTPGRTAGEIDHPTDPNVVVLRAEQTGGFTMIGFNFAVRPYFTLYGDGTVIYRPLEQPQQDLGFPPLQVATTDEDQVQALLRFALGPGRLLNAKPTYPNPLVADAPDTVFTLAAGEFSKRVQITALGLDNTEMPGDAADLNGFRQLDALLNDFGKQVAAGQATAVGVYTPATYTGMLFPSEPTPETKDWPWPEIETTDLLPGEGEFGGSLVALTPAQVEKVLPVPNGGVVGYQVEGPDKNVYILSIRPDLPDDPPVGTPSPSAQP